MGNALNFHCTNNSHTVKMRGRSNSNEKSQPEKSSNSSNHSKNEDNIDAVNAIPTIEQSDETVPNAKRSKTFDEQQEKQETIAEAIEETDSNARIDTEVTSYDAPKIDCTGETIASESVDATDPQQPSSNAEAIANDQTTAPTTHSTVENFENSMRIVADAAQTLRKCFDAVDACESEALAELDAILEKASALRARRETELDQARAKMQKLAACLQN